MNKYIRCSTAIQNTSRQEVNSDEFDKVFINYVSGSVPFFERGKGYKKRKATGPTVHTKIGSWEDKSELYLFERDFRRARD